MQLPTRSQLALGATSLIVGGRLLSKRLPSQHLCGRYSLFASTSVATKGGTAGPKPEAQPVSIQYSFPVQVNPAAVWGIGAILVCGGLGAWLKSPQIAQLGKNGNGTLGLVVGSLAIYRSDMTHLESSLNTDMTHLKAEIDKWGSRQEQMMIKLTEMSCTLQR